MRFHNKTGIDKTEYAAVDLTAHALGAIERVYCPLEFVLSHGTLRGLTKLTAGKHIQMTSCLEHRAGGLQVILPLFDTFSG